MTDTVGGSARGASQAGGKRAKGLRVGRVFTKPGVHPYDEVNWVRRDVVMTNWRDGSVNFEQRGVEFPDFWSVNALNIVTTKYFRGALGTPAREWSLKHLIDRVVTKYVATGRQHGYFATDDDAEIFQHELTWALLHQVFSFNSPVWFNVGTDAPQQVSACQPYYAPVSTPEGFIPIGKLVEENAVGAKVYDAHGLTRVVATKANGVKDVLRVQTKAGYTLEVTADHMVWRAASPGTGEFVPAGALRNGDSLLYLEPGVSGSTSQVVEIVGIEGLGPMEVFDIQTESGEYLSENLRVHNCFILSVDDTMESILEWYKEEGLIFKGGSGAGVNLSRIRSSHELLSSGGTASGPVSFMRGADASAGTIKSGGATRRAAKMVVLDVDHPDVEEFIWTKAREEEKIRVLRDSGYDMDLGSRDITSVQYQNANNSVRVSDEFMRAVESGEKFGLRARTTGEVASTVDSRDLFRQMAGAAWECADPGIQYDDTINDWHTCPESGRITASNPCSEYVHLDNSSCNLASLNLMKFLREDETFDAKTFANVVEIVITAMDISICFADFPTAKIGDTSRAFRQLGIGYANLGALLMATGHAYDSEGGRALAAAITSLMTGTAYKRSAEIAAAVGPYDGYARNAEGHKRVMRKHAAANDAVRALDDMTREALAESTKAWQDCVTLGDKHGYRNAQASVIAPTGCLVGDTLVPSDRGLVRLSELGDPYGDRWQDLDLTISTDEGPRSATRFFVNGEEPTRLIRTEGGYRIQGTLTHRVKVVAPDTGEWVWKRLADIAAGDMLPVQMGMHAGEPRRVPLPVLDQAYYTEDGRLRVPDSVEPDLAELVGYFMADGSLDAEGIRLCVSDADLDVVERLRILSKDLFGLEPVVSLRTGYHEVTLQSVRLARWWKAAGFAKRTPAVDHEGKGWTPHVPASIRETNDPAVYAAFLRGLFEADGTVLDRVPSISTSSSLFADDVRALLLVMRLPTTTRVTRSKQGEPIHHVGLRGADYTKAFGETVGLFGVHAGGRLSEPDSPPAADYILEKVTANEDGGVQPTYDLSVPDNVTYVAGGLVSHNTIGLAMDCDTTGVEPDLALVKYKKLVGGGSMQFVNQTVSRALRQLGYQQEQVEAIVDYIAEHGHVVDAPGLRQEHYEVFDCAMGTRAIRPMGHVLMLAAVQPFVSGSISKTVNLPESATVDHIEDIYFQGWKLGLKALAVYRDNCKVGQPLSVGKGDRTDQVEEKAEPEKVVEYRPVRRRLPKSRPSMTTSFTVGGAEGYMTAGQYPDNGLGELFLKMSKQGSTLAGMMDAFSIAVSIGLQYGVPLETFVQKFTNMRFEPSGMTDDPDVRLATSVLDYIFRRLALDYMPFETRAAMGIHTAAERARQLETGSYDELDVETLAQSAPIERRSEEREDHAAEETGEDRGQPASDEAPASSQVGSSTELIEAQQGRTADAPLCFTCGTKMRPAGSCYVCEGCGSTSGCS